MYFDFEVSLADRMARSLNNSYFFIYNIILTLLLWFIIVLKINS